jgi:pyruvate formate lyase activating enzyme
LIKNQLFRIGGFIKSSFVDYPGKISSVIFSQGCPFLCHYCHNGTLVIPTLFSSPIAEEEVFNFLTMRQGEIEGVVISGGEPTMQSTLFSFIKRIKLLRYPIKLDTNGINPFVLKSLLEANLLDYVAMDLKAPLSKYNLVCGVEVDIKLIEQSINILLNSSIAYEFRTTLLPLFHNEADVELMAHLIEGASCYVLQSCVCKNSLNEDLAKEHSFSKEQLEHLQKIALKHVKLCKIRHNSKI